MSKYQVSFVTSTQTLQKDKHQNIQGSKRKLGVPQEETGGPHVWLHRKLAFEQISLICGKTIRERDGIFTHQRQPFSFVSFVLLCCVTGSSIAKTDLKLGTRLSHPSTATTGPYHYSWLIAPLFFFFYFFLPIIAECRKLQRKWACHRPRPLGPAPEEWLSRGAKLRRADSQTLNPRLKPALGGDRKRVERVQRLEDVATNRALASQVWGPGFDT